MINHCQTQPGPAKTRRIIDPCRYDWDARSIELSMAVYGICCHGYPSPTLYPLPDYSSCVPVATTLRKIGARTLPLVLPLVRAFCASHSLSSVHYYILIVHREVPWPCNIAGYDRLRLVFDNSTPRLFVVFFFFFLSSSAVLFLHPPPFYFNRGALLSRVH